MPIFIYTPDQIQRLGLCLIGVDHTRQKRQNENSNLEDFKAHYCVDPIVVAQIWEELQTTTIKEARIQAKHVHNRNSGCNVKNYLRSIHFLMRYATDRERKCSSGHARETIRKWTWFFVEKIAALRAKKIVWPGTWTANFIISVDGVHCRYHEEKHAILSKNPALWSHKFNGPGLAYEIALDVIESRVVWLKGPFQAGANNDRNIFTNAHPHLNLPALRDLIPHDKRVIADGGYHDRSDPRMSTPNSHDDPALRTFKARARMRQENFNGRLKCFECLTRDFRSGME